MAFARKPKRLGLAAAGLAAASAAAPANAVVVYQELNATLGTLSSPVEIMIGQATFPWRAVSKKGGDRATLLWNTPSSDLGTLPVTKGALIDGTPPVSTTTSTKARGVYSTISGNTPYFALGETGFVAFNFLDTDDDYKWGWMRFSNDGTVAGSVFVDYAYESSGGSILAGAGIPATIPVPASLPLALAGFVALFGPGAWRRYKDS